MGKRRDKSVRKKKGSQPIFSERSLQTTVTTRSRRWELVVTVPALTGNGYNRWHGNGSRPNGTRLRRFLLAERLQTCPQALQHFLLHGDILRRVGPRCDGQDTFVVEPFLHEDLR